MPQTPPKSATRNSAGWVPSSGAPVPLIGATKAQLLFFHTQQQSIPESKTEQKSSEFKLFSIAGMLDLR